ncbi:MAG: hypothetical protein Q9221_001530 [Calogaya cf. arnoldii]
MRHSSITFFSCLLSYTTALPTSLSTSVTKLAVRDDTSSLPLSSRQISPIAVSNPGSIQVIRCLTSARLQDYNRFEIQYLITYSAGDVMDNLGDLSQFLFSLEDTRPPTVAGTDPLLPPTFALGCDASKQLYWSPMYNPGSRFPFAADIIVFNVDVDAEEQAHTAFCGIMTNSHQVAPEKKNQYQLCNSPNPPSIAKPPPVAISRRQDSKTKRFIEGNAYKSSTDPVGLNIGNGILIPASTICSTSARRTRLTQGFVGSWILEGARGILQDPSNVFSLTPVDDSIAQVDPLNPPTFAQGCDPSKELFWGPMYTLLGDLISAPPVHPVDIGVFIVEKNERASGGATVTFCGVMTNSGQVADKKYQYQLCNAE